MNSIRVHNAAERDICEQADFFAQRDLPLSLRFLNSVSATLRQLCEMPGMGPVQEYRNPALKGMRRWPVRGFPKLLIFYRPTHEGIEVLRVVHGARDLPKLFND